MTTVGRLLLYTVQVFLQLSIHPCIHPFIHSFTHSLTYSSTHSFTHSFTHVSIHSPSHSSIQSPSHSTIHPVILPFIHPFIRSFTHLFTHSSIHSPIYSPIHPFICLPQSELFFHQLHPFIWNNYEFFRILTIRKWLHLGSKNYTFVIFHSFLMMLKNNVIFSKNNLCTVPLEKKSRIFNKTFNFLVGNNFVANFQSHFVNKILFYPKSLMISFLIKPNIRNKVRKSTHWHTPIKMKILCPAMIILNR